MTRAVIAKEPAAVPAEERDFWEARYWQAISSREAEMDGVVYYSVLSTGVYCRPSCPSRKPKRENVVFFVRREEAENAGFRPCLRCRPDCAREDPRFEMVRKVCRYLEAHTDERVTLKCLGRELGISPFHVQRTFKQLLGVSPRAWTEARRLERFKQQVRHANSVTEAMYDVGFGASSRLYERSSAGLGMTPAAYRKSGEGVEIRFTTIESGLGWTLIAATGRGVCAIRFGDSSEELEHELRGEFPRAQVRRADGGFGAYADAVRRLIEGDDARSGLPLDIRATAFQRRVWEALRSIPSGETRSYSDIAKAIGEPHATRAVASACAANPVAVAIPCHRVMRRDGSLGGYRWGAVRKTRLLEAERESRSRLP
jgi:AraC family transcriptional regulator of adaptative response/methylated-DNA-[protein]-cysteine methyltransferase